MTQGRTTRAAHARLWLGIVLLAVGLGGHLLAAESTGGTSMHYRHHILGFVFLSAVAWVVLELLARRFWPGRRDVTVLALGAVQAILGLMIYSRLV
jgi:heme/copper-type cytochrome/quinol oxidase subunit 4